MTDSDKKLLFTELQMRLNSGLKVIYDDGDPAHKTNVMELYGFDRWGKKVSTGMGFFTYDAEHIKPYLRPATSVTDEEWEKLSSLESCLYDDDCSVFLAGYQLTMWLIDRKIDFNDMIGKGLALPAPEGMYNLD